jgi:hypothetical protein
MINTANNSSNNWMTPTVPNLSKATANQPSMTKKLKFYSKTFKQSSTKELRTWKNPKIHPKNHQNKFNHFSKSLKK